MDKTKSFNNLLFNDEYDIQQKLLNLILLAAMAGGMVSMLLTLIIGTSLTGLMSVLLLMLVVGVSLYLSVVRKKVTAASILIIGMANMILFPFMYMHAGGMKSGMPIWFVLGLTFSWLILRGKVCYIMYALNVAAMCSCLLYEVYHPERIQTLSDGAMAFDIAQSMIVISCIFGVVFKYKSYAYEKQKCHLMEQEKKLMQAMEELEKANKAKSDFLANMSHEIRTPINAVLGMDEMILRENKNTEVEEYAQNIKSAGQSLLSIINDILDFSKIESGKLEMIPVEYDLASLINDCYNMIFMRAQEKDLEFVVSNDPTIPRYLYGDEVRVRQIIVNLLTNGVKYTSEGSVKLTIGWEKIDEEQMNLVVSVKDTGIGISAENQKKLFHSFQRIEERRNRNIEGTGLGLAITQQLLGYMGGNISVSSTQGKGSIFSVRIPQRVINNEKIGDYHTKFESMNYTEKYKAKFSAPDASVLVVDDVQMNLDVIKGLLKSTMVRVDTAISGMESLAILKTKKYDVILLDHMMPVMDGMEVLHRLQESKGGLNYDTPVIALTANAIMGAEEKYIAAGFKDYLSKPVRPADLESMIMKYLPETKICEPADEKDDAVADVQEDIVSTASQGSENANGGYPDFLDTELGLTYCCSNEDFYKQMIEAFVHDNKTQKLEELYAAENWKEYQVCIHGVKSSAMTIGAKALSEEARALELALKLDNNPKYVQENHHQFIQRYGVVLKELAAVH